MKLFLLVATLSAYPLFASSQFVREGDYRVDSCLVRVEKQKWPGGSYEIYVYHEDSKFPALFAFDPNMEKVTRGLCENFYTVLSPTVVTKKTQGNLKTFHLECGGLFKPKYGKSELVFDTSLGEFTKLKSYYKVVSFGFSDGFHSGPIKSVFHQFSCTRP